MSIFADEVEKLGNKIANLPHAEKRNLGIAIVFTFWAIVIGGVAAFVVTQGVTASLAAFVLIGATYVLVMPG